MKKILILFICLFALLFVGCVANGNVDENDKNNDIENKEDDNTLQWWIDLFTFDNVTIMLKNNVTIKKR